MKKGIAWILVFTLFFCVCGSGLSAQAAQSVKDIKEPFSGGSGTEEDPYLIGSAKDLRRMANLVRMESWAKDNPYMTASYLLTKDVDLGGSASPWLPIGDNGSVNQELGEFEGTFDGGGHTVSGMYIRHSMDSLLEKKQTTFGLFGQISNGTVKNLTISDSSIEVTGKRGSPTVGAITGRASGAVIENCTVTDSVSLVAPYNVGGIVGEASLGNTDVAAIVGCSSSASIQSTGPVGQIGGIVALAFCPVRDCENHAALSGSEVAGITAHATCDISGCTNYGDIHGLRYGAGIVISFSNGALNAGMIKDVSISDCVNLGRVEVENGDAAGIVSRCQAAAVERCENKGDIYGTLRVGGIAADCTLGSVFASDSGDAVIRDCANSGAILHYGEETAGYLGGIVGSVSTNSSSVLVDNCVNTGAVGSADTLKGKAGGIIGEYSHEVKNAEGEMRFVLRACENSGDVCGGISGVGGVIGFVDSDENNARLLFIAEDCVNSGTVLFASSLSRGGGIIGEIDCRNSYSEITNCRNSGDVTPEYTVISWAERWYPWSCVLGGIVGHIGEGRMKYNPAESELVTEGDPAALVKGCTNTGKVVTYEDTGITFYAGDICGRNDFPISIEP